ncbi:hypothetical protein EWB00_008988 [Schistosoma japonicum]|uniref:Uncharacterized protein n=1 Tax=Schistosoma japonicum TaxID=6182 RepID=A0A4Z2CNB1_SCHJA|nr:hypothetical protein EWB00_008988 [Schistosoma japonicum]
MYHTDQTISSNTSQYSFTANTISAFAIPGGSEGGKLHNVVYKQAAHMSDFKNKLRDYVKSIISLDFDLHA